MKNNLVYLDTFVNNEIPNSLDTLRVLLAKFTSMVWSIGSESMLLSTPDLAWSLRFLLNSPDTLQVIPIGFASMAWSTLRIHAFKHTWFCLIDKVLATWAAKFLEPSSYCKSTAPPPFGFVYSVIVQFKRIKHKFSN